MDRTRVLGVLALGTLLLLAGCQAPGTPERPEFSPTVTVVNAPEWSDLDVFSDV